MTETFDTFSKRSLIHKLITISMVPFLPCCIIAAIQPKFLSGPFEGYFIIIFFLSFFALLSGMIIGSSSSVLTYVKDGEITFNENSVVVNTSLYNLNDLDKVEIRAKSYKGSRGRAIGDGTGNRIKIYKKSKDILDIHFVINSKDNLTNLEEILKQWKNTGFKIIQTYFI